MMSTNIGKGLHALVVDDEESVRFLFDELLPDLGFTFTLCENLATARAYLQDNTPDLVLLDKNLPDGTGLELASELGGKDCAVVMISGFANVSSAVEAIQLGVADYIVKPFDISDIEARLTRALEVLKLRRTNTKLVADLEAKTSLLERIVATDHVTGASNFAFLRQRLTEEIERSRRDGKPLSLILLDIDGFAQLNEEEGHASADKLLTQVARGLAGKLEGFPERRLSDVVARVGADEFGLLLPATARDGAGVVAAALQSALHEHLRVPGGKPFTASVGSVTFPNDGDDGPALFSALDLAMRAAKREPDRATAFVSYSEDLGASSKEQRALAEKRSNQVRALDTSLNELQFRYLYQPIVNMSGEIFAYEALVRPQNDAFAHPGDLFETAERAGRVLDLGRVLRRMCVEPMGQLTGERRLFVNLHPLDLFDAELLSGVETSLSKFAERIVLEVTEVAEIRNFDRARANLEVLRKQGFSIAVDDLGAGYSGLNNLALLSPDFVKLDMGLVRGVDKNPRMGSLIRHIIDFANSEGMTVIAEGVETKEEYETVQKLGAHLIQGYYFARPSPPFLELDAK